MKPHKLHTSKSAQQQNLANRSFPAMAKFAKNNIKKSVLVAIFGACMVGCFDKTPNNSSAASSPGTSVETLSHDGETREFILYVPSSYNGNEALPLFLNFHGFGGTASDFMDWTDMRDLAEQENFILVYPQGTLLEGYPHWNSALPSAENKSSADDFGFVEMMIDEIAAAYNVNTNRVYAAGYSNGSFFSYALACYRSDLVAAVGSVSGTMAGIIPDCEPTHPTSMINIHGTLDGVVPYNGGSGYSSVEDVMNYWIDFNDTETAPTTSTINSSGTTIEHFSYANGNGGTEVAHYRVNGGEHVWFEADFDGSSTGQLIWDFVSRYDKNGLIVSAE